MGSSPTLYSLCADVLRAAVLCADVLRAAVLCIAALRTAAALRAAICTTAPRAVARFERPTPLGACNKVASRKGSHWFECVSTFPLRFRQRFHCVSVNVSVTFPSTFPLRFRWAGVRPMETIWKLSQRFQGPLSIYIYIYLSLSIYIYIYIYTYT